MRRTVFAIIIAIAVTALLMNITWIVYEEQFPKNNKEDNDQKDKTVQTPEEVNLTLNISSRGLTNYSNDFWVEGAPEDSNYTWTLDGELIGYEKEVRHTFFDVGIFNLVVMVKWDIYSKVQTEEISIERSDNMGSRQITYPWYWNIDIEPYRAIITTIEPGMSEPTCWINISISISNTLVKCWLELMEDDKGESFEILNYDVIPLGQNQYERSLRFDKDFFAERETRETYFFMIRLEISNSDSGTLEGDVSYEVIYS